MLLDGYTGTVNMHTSKNTLGRKGYSISLRFVQHGSKRKSQNVFISFPIFKVLFLEISVFDLGSLFILPWWMQHCCITVFSLQTFVCLYVLYIYIFTHFIMSDTKSTLDLSELMD